MKDIPCIMSAPMVQALMAGRKRMTRRLAGRYRKVTDKATGAVSFAGEQTQWVHVGPGDLIWIRESHWRWGYWRGTKKSGNPSYEFIPTIPEGRDPIVYETPEAPVCKFAQVIPGYSNRPAIFHPRAASRITLKVTAARIERLQDINEVDAENEGISYDVRFGWQCPGFSFVGTNARDCFALVWGALHGAGTWEKNPEVVALSFDVHLQNIDTLKEAA